MQLTDEELSARQQEILAAEDLLSDAAKQKLLDELLQRRKARQLKRLEERGREEFPEHLERRHITLDLDDEAKQGLVLLDVKLFARMRFEKPRIYIELIHRQLYVRPDAPDAGVVAPPNNLSIFSRTLISALSHQLFFLAIAGHSSQCRTQTGSFVDLCSCHMCSWGRLPPKLLR